ncbi:MAG: ester cyclase, partial [Thermomicrobiales bacterium]
LEIWGEGDLGILAGLVAEDVIDHNAFPGQAPGREGMGDILVAFRAAFPDLTLTNNDIVVGTDRVVLRWTAVGTHEGELMGIPPSGAVVTMTGIDILRVEDGLVVERWGEYNGLQLMQQIGAFDS